jgi:hypothetical protein
VGEADQAAATERKKEKTKKNPLPTGQPLSKTKTELLPKYQHQDWILEEYHQNLNKERNFIDSEPEVFVCVFVSCLFAHLSMWIFFLFVCIVFWGFFYAL